MKIRIALEVACESESGLRSVENLMKQVARSINQTAKNIKVERIIKSETPLWKSKSQKFLN